MSSAINPTKSAVKYLPFKKSHVVVIRELSVSALKESAKKRQKDREEISYNTALNYIAKSLGFARGFGGFREDGEKLLGDFMAKHELRRRVDLVTPHDDLGCAVKLSYRQIADRLFESGRAIPTRIFTGYNIPWGDISDRWFDHNPLWGNKPASIDLEVTNSKLQHARDFAPDEIQQCLEAAVAGLYLNLQSQIGLLDDMLLDYDGSDFDLSGIIPKLYWPPDTDLEIKEREWEKLRQMCGLFRQWMDLCNDGWCEVIPFNLNLIFLRGKGGEYDFVFQGLRDEPFKKNPFSPYLRSGDIPKSNDTHHFDRWLYFQHEGYLEADRHHAEALFYASGGTTMSYPGEREILRAHLIATGTYRPPRKDKPRAEGYKTLSLGDEEFNVSELITIRQFKEFLADEPDYLKHRANCSGLDDWACVNFDNPDNLPVAATWYDANAYAAWISRKHGLPVRLMQEAEYALLRSTLDTSGVPPLVGGMIPWHKWPELLAKDDRPIDLPTSPMSELLQDVVSPKPRLTNLYRVKSVVWVQNHDGLRFLLSPFFGEWLDHEGVAANSAYGSSLCYGHMSPLRGKFTPKSTGRYKGMKIGFRLCYRNGTSEPILS